jgi:hypothetical protein
MVLPAQQLRFQARRGGSSAGLVAVLAMATIGGGLYLASRRPEAPPVLNDDAVGRVAALARAEQDSELLRRAIRERQAIVGMTFREVETAKGAPHVKQRGETLPDALRAKGGVENWVYQTGVGDPANVLFGATGRVVYSSDIGEKPEPHQVIRR